MSLMPERIASALQDAISSRYVTVTAIEDPDGALAEACCVDVYLLTAPGRDGFTVSCWHAHSTEPNLNLSAATLEEAVQYVKAEFGTYSVS